MIFSYLFVVAAALTLTTDDPDDDDDDFDEEDESSEADDDSRIYKNPRNSPSSDCPRDEDQVGFNLLWLIYPFRTTLVLSINWFLICF